MGELSLSARLRMDETCDRFEDACQAGQRPRPEDFLGEAQGPERAALLRHLLRLERHDRRAAGAAPSAALARLPEAERADWRKLWADVAALLKEAGKTK
jgi:hypothetical protein